jgi:hypothetical protein
MFFRFQNINKVASAFNSTYIKYHVYPVLHSAKSMTMNGSNTYENVTSGLLFMLGINLDLIQHKEWGYDSNNQPITGNACPTKYRVDWYSNNQGGTMYLFLP